MSVYAFTFDFIQVKDNDTILLITLISAFVGAYLGNKLLKKTTLTFFKWFVTIFMITIALLMIFGFID